MELKTEFNYGDKVFMASGIRNPKTVHRPLTVKSVTVKAGEYPDDAEISYEVAPPEGVTLTLKENEILSPEAAKEDVEETIKKHIETLLKDKYPDFLLSVSPKVIYTEVVPFED